MNKNESILLVEDDPAGRAMLGLTLRQAGYHVRTASDGIGALQELEREPADWMITDGRMHPLDGLDLSARAKALLPDLRIVMISAIYTDKDIKSYPIEALFPKPVQTESLLTWLSNGNSAHLKH